MKRQRLLLLVFAVLLLGSIGSFVFLNSVETGISTHTSEPQKQLQMNEKETIVLPDVQFIKRIFESGEYLLRAF